jgi:hypothetical protein
MEHPFLRLIGAALAAAVLALLAFLPHSAHGQPLPSDTHEVPPFAAGRTDIVRDAP